MRRTYTPLALLLIFLVSACGGGGTKPIITSFTATPTSLPVGGGSVALSWNVSGATSLSVDQGVGSVTPVTTGSTNKSISATTTFTLTATNAAGSVTSTAQVTVATGPVTITVSGKVRDNDLQPVASAPVVITSGAFTATTTSSANGDFSVVGVPTPYDATVVASASKRAAIYKGLTRPDPTLIFLGLTPPTTNSATISGTISGGAGFPEPANHVTRVRFGSPETTNQATANTATGTYTMGPSWNGPATTTGTLHALQWQRDAASLPTQYKGYGNKQNVALSNGGVFANQNIAMTPVVNASLSGNVTVASGQTLVSKEVLVVFDANTRISLLRELTAPAGFTYTVPSIAGATLMLRAAVEKAGANEVVAIKIGLAANATNVNLTMPAGPELTLPVNAATNINNTTSFSWSSFSGGVHAASFDGPAGQPDYVVFSAGTDTTIPNLSALGMGLPPATSYQWQVYGFAPFANIDAVAGPTGYVNVFEGTSATDSSVGITAIRTFTTAP